MITVVLAFLVLGAALLCAPGAVAGVRHSAGHASGAETIVFVDVRSRGPPRTRRALVRPTDAVLSAPIDQPSPSTDRLPRSFVASTRSTVGRARPRANA